jgi:hypothetical protein
MVNARRLELLQADAPIAPHEDGALVIDETGDRWWTCWLGQFVQP